MLETSSRKMKSVNLANYLKWLVENTSRKKSLERAPSWLHYNTEKNDYARTFAYIVVPKNEVPLLANVIGLHIIYEIVIKEQEKD